MERGFARLALWQWLRHWRLGRFMEGLESKKKAFGAFRAFPGCQTAGLEFKTKTFAFLGPEDKKLLPSLALWFAHWQWRVWPWLALAEAAESV